MVKPRYYEKIEILLSFGISLYESNKTTFDFNELSKKFKLNKSFQKKE